MNFTFTQLLIVAPLVFVAGFIDAVAGGGGLISLPAYLIAGIPAPLARGTNKMSACFGTTVATIRYAKHGCINWKVAVWCIASALIGSTIGAKLIGLVSDEIFKIIIMIGLPLVAVFVLRKHSLPETPIKEPFSLTKTIAISTAVSLVLGIYDGFIGPGTGTFMLIVFTSLCRMSLAEANGLSKVTNLATNVAANVVFMLEGNTIYIMGLICGAFGIAGSLIGTQFFFKKGVKGTKIVIICVLAIFLVKTILELCGVI